jgi:hypothetical protein
VFGEPSPLQRNVESPLTTTMLSPLDARCRVVQFDRRLTDGDFRVLGQFLSQYPKVELRAYGSYDGSIRDLDFLEYFPTLRGFQADVYHSLEDIEGLRQLREDLTFLGLGQTKRRFSLAPLTRFRSLRALYLEGQTKDIGVISELVDIRRLTLRSITLPDLSLIVPLTGLRALDLKLGGTRDLSLLPALTNLLYLEIWMVKGFDDLRPVAEARSLEMLFLQSLKNVTSIPSLHKLTHLTSVHLETMKGLQDLSPLLTAPQLENVSLLDMGQLQPEDVAMLAAHPTLKTAIVGLGSKRKNDAATALLPLPRGTYSRHPALSHWA